MKSLERLMSMNSSVIYPGHGPEVLNPIAKIKEYIHHRNERERSILDCLSKDKSKAISIDNIVQIVYKVIWYLYLLSLNGLFGGFSSF